MIRASAYALIGLMTLAMSRVFGAAPVFTNLGKEMLAQSVSDDGQVVAGISIRDGASGVFRWRAGLGAQVLGGLSSGKADISADGATIAATVYTDRTEAAFWKQRTGWVPLSATNLIPALPGWDTTSQAISANGRRLAGGTTPPPLDYGWVRGFSFNPDTWTDRYADYGWSELPLVGKAAIASATGISDNGRIQIGIAADRGSSFYAVRWIDGFVKELHDAAEERLGGESVSCNANCDVIVGGGGGSSAVQPILAWRLQTRDAWPACYFEPLKGGPRPALRHYAYDVSDNGGVVVGAYFYDVRVGQFVINIAKGFLWVADARGGWLVDLQEYLDLLGQPMLNTWQNLVVAGVSANGRYIVGYGEDAFGQLRSWRIDFGKVPQLSGALPASSSYTRCPSAAIAPASAAEFKVSSESPTPNPTAAVFRGDAGRDFQLRWRGVAVYGGFAADVAVQHELVKLGGDHFYDLTLRATLTLIRDAAGVVTAMRVRAGGNAATWVRR